MKKRGLLSALAAAAGMLLLILDGKTALQGAAEGIELCIKTLIPSLFPFFVLSSVMTNALSGQGLPFLRGIGRICHIPKGSEFLLAIGFLGGYPVGAQNVVQTFRRGLLSRSDAKRMVAFCNNAGPSFIFGIVAQMFSDSKIPWVLWIVHITSAVIVAVVMPVPESVPFQSCPGDNSPFTKLLENAVRVMAIVCSWVILFRMVITFLEKWILWVLPIPVRVCIAGILELSNGCLQLRLIEAEGMRFVTAAGLLSFGGLCVSLQTVSVSGGLSLRSYFPGKLLQTALSVLMAIGAQGFLFSEECIQIPYYLTGVLLAICILLIVLICMPKKAVAFLCRLLYNQHINTKRCVPCCFAKK